MKTNWAERFQWYDETNPQVYVAFKKFAYELLATRRRGGAKAIMERVRWETRTMLGNDSFKINNNYTAYYARKLVAEAPRFAGFFNSREGK